MPRASWNGFLRLSLVSCPVSLVPATTEGKRIRFNQLNAKTGNRVQQQLIDSKTGEVVDRDDIVKGYEYDRGRYATISDDELKALQIESSKMLGSSCRQFAAMRKCVQPSSGLLRTAKSTPIWWRLPKALSSAGRVPSTRRVSTTNIKTRCASLLRKRPKDRLWHRAKLKNRRRSST